MGGTTHEEFNFCEHLEILDTNSSRFPTALSCEITLIKHLVKINIDANVFMIKFNLRCATCQASNAQLWKRILCAKIHKYFMLSWT